MKLKIGDKYKIINNNGYYFYDNLKAYSKCSTDNFLEVHGYLDTDEIYIIHRIDGPAVIKIIGDKLYNRYFIDGFEISKEDFKKHPQVRIAKLNRVMNS